MSLTIIEDGQNCIALWRAVLSRAYDDLNPPKNGNWKMWEKERNSYCVSDVSTFHKIVKWIKIKDFENICDLADLNIEYTRKYFIDHALNTYNLMPQNLQQKLKGIVL